MKKRFLITQIIVFILLTACLVGVTYSWSTRPEVKGGFMSTPMTFNYSSTINGNQCTAKTYVGTLGENGIITYPEDADDYITSVSKTSRSSGQVLYFRTVVSNASDIDTNVSFLIDVNCDTSLDNNFAIGTSAPVLKEIAYSSSAEDKWIPVVSQYQVIKNAETAVIDWYVTFNASGQFGIDGFTLANN